MSGVMSTGRGSVFGHASDDWRGQTAPARRGESSGGLSTGWVVAGLAAVALGAWYHFGGDLKRYIKMERM
jgi:hypothetical protein